VVPRPRVEERSVRVPQWKTGRAAWIPALILGVTAGLLLLHDRGARDSSALSRETAGRSPLLGSLAALTARAGISPRNSPSHSKTALAASTSPPPASDDRTNIPVQLRSGVPKAGPGGPARSMIPRSPLERSPGYYPPDDPESLSVVAGRREAPLVALELSGGAVSSEALARAILGALGRRDEGALHALGLTRREFETICWREFPESRPITHITAEDAWTFSAASNHAGVSRMVGLYGGRELDLVKVERGGAFPYRNFVRHYGMALTARDHATGEVFTIRSAPSWIERHGRFKVLIYKD